MSNRISSYLAFVLRAVPVGSVSTKPLRYKSEFKISEYDIGYLNIEEIRALFAECENSRSKKLAPIVKIFLVTETRWSEAEGLKGNQIRAGKIIFVKTIGKKNRAVQMAEKLQAELPTSRKAQSLFKHCYSAFRKAMQRAGIETPAWHLTYVLRDTFASHSMLNSGNILMLQQILRHTDIKATM